MVTGLGTPVVDSLVPHLVGSVTITDTTGPHLVDLLGSETDYDGELTITSTSNGSHGTVSVSNGQIYYSLTDLSARTDSFTYTLSDPAGRTFTSSVNVLVDFDNPDVTIGQGQVAQSLVYTEDDGTVVTVSISKGTATLQPDRDRAWAFPARTCSRSRAPHCWAASPWIAPTVSSLSIITDGSAAKLGGIDGAAVLGTLNAPDIHLVDSGIDLSGSGYIG